MAAERPSTSYKVRGDVVKRHSAPIRFSSVIMDRAVEKDARQLIERRKRTESSM